MVAACAGQCLRGLAASARLKYFEQGVRWKQEAIKRTLLDTACKRRGHNHNRLAGLNEASLVHWCNCSSGLVL